MDMSPAVLGYLFGLFAVGVVAFTVGLRLGVRTTVKPPPRKMSKSPPRSACCAAISSAAPSRSWNPQARRSGLPTPRVLQTSATVWSVTFRRWWGATGPRGALPGNDRSSPQLSLIFRSISAAAFSAFLRRSKTLRMCLRSLSLSRSSAATNCSCSSSRI